MFSIESIEDIAAIGRIAPVERLSVSGVEDIATVRRVSLVEMGLRHYYATRQRE